ncbi:hypothetical protein [Bifidobacterium eulemuris]|uniref:Uncharacterized protein n=1 Tax=Bifidobacterium eulemuris TaxID=1765219 RepID=A0A261GAS8_9BIFI|nr:hypothetical protein [Bifidobacterium eulemuris]OZG68285.1 hypothetical protein BEUL_1298 [Bifidobacterium eulemuris]QOL31661.1 hypothetical protein BE0216_03685 [Bifidobacterium eulemuris]
MPRQTTLTGYPTSGGFARFDLRRMGDLVCCYSTMNNITGDGFNSLNLTVPVGWRPPHGELPPVLMRTDRTANEVVLNVDTNNGYKITYYSGISTVNTYHTGFGLWKTHDYL